MHPAPTDSRVKDRVSDFCSIIVCTYNRAQTLRRCLRSLAEQSLDQERFEVIVADDGSNDDTAGVCAEVGADIKYFSYIRSETNKGPASMRNLGLRSARGNHILFIDDDCVAERHWAGRLSSALKSEPLIAGTIASPVSNYLKLCHNIAQFHPFMPGAEEGPVGFIACANMGCHRAVLDELGGFEEGMVHAEDMEFVLRARQRGYGAYYTPDAMVTHNTNRDGFATVIKYAATHAEHTILLRNKHHALLRTPFIFRSALLTLLASPVIALRVTLGIYLGNRKLARFIHTAPVVFATKLAWCWGAARGLMSEPRIKANK